MITRFFPVVLLVVFCLFTPRSAHAQGPLTAGTVILTPYIGVAFDPDADASLAVAGSLGYLFTDAFAIEGELGHLFDMVPDDADVDSSLTTIHGSLTYFFVSDYVILPYVTGGIGVGNFSHRVEAPPDSIDRTEIGFNLGAGVTYQIGDDDRYMFRGDFRYFKHIDDIPSAWRIAAGVTLRLTN